MPRPWSTAPARARWCCAPTRSTSLRGAALLAGATPVFANSDPARNFAPAFDRIADDVWQKVQLLFVCTPGNPTGAVLSLEDWKQLFALSDRYGFVIASDECYSEIYFDEAAPRWVRWKPRTSWAAALTGW